MPIDILDQPRGGILETVVLYLKENKDACSEDLLIDKMTGSIEGKSYIARYVIDLLEAVGIIQVRNEEIHLEQCPVLERWTDTTKPFDIYFKIELLSKISQSKDPYIGYFGDALRLLFDLGLFERSKLEESLREARKNRGIPVSPGEELGGKIQFCEAFLRYFNMLQKVVNSYSIHVPRIILTTTISLALEDIDKPSVKIYSELLNHIDRNYLPVLNRKENRILKSIYAALNNQTLMSSFRFAYVPDGGQTVTLNNKEYNSIIFG
ncbi:MAG: hypothetical protein QXX08_04300 [Candidatus Bathyarchaeia archaeon]